MILQQGSTYLIPVRLRNKTSGQPITIDETEIVEFRFGNVRKIYPGDVTVEDGVFIIPLTQEETFAMQGMIQYQTRVLFNNIQTKGTPVYYANITESLSKVVLKKDV